MAMVVIMGMIGVCRGCVLAKDVRIATKITKNLGACKACDARAKEGKKYDDLIHGLRFSPS